MSSPLTLRLDGKTRERIVRLARRKHLSTSEVVRQAIEAWAKRQESAGGPYEAMADLLGIAHSDDPKRSERTGRRFAKLLKGRRRSG